MKFEYKIKQKSWFRNMDNVIVNYRHKGEKNDLYLIHMFHRCDIDRIGYYPSVYKWHK